MTPGHMRTGQTAGGSGGSHAAEVVRLHEVIAAWTTGAAANTDAAKRADATFDQSDQGGTEVRVRIFQAAREWPNKKLAGAA